MGVSVDNLVFEQSTTTGTGNFSVQPMINDATGQAQSFKNFSDAFGTGTTNQFYYSIRNRIQNPLEYEIGIGYMSTSSTLIRQTILESSNGNSAVNFSAGSKDVICDVPASMQSVWNYKAVSTNYNMLANDGLMEITGGSPTITLITAVGYVGPDIRIKLTAGSGNGTIVPLAASGQTIDGQASIVLTQQNASISINSNGANWLLL